MGALAWFRRHWKAILGGIFLIPPILRGLRFVLDFGGYIDFVVAHMTQPGWLGVVIADLVDPPSGIILPLILLGLGLIYWDSRRSAVRTPAVAVNDPTTLHPEAVSDVNLTIESNLADLPNRCPREGQIASMRLFYHPNSGVTEPIGFITKRCRPEEDVEWFPDLKFPQVYRCEITNYGIKPLLQVGLKFNIEYHETSPGESGQTIISGNRVHSGEWWVLLPKIDPGKRNAAVFYVYNESDYFARVTPPDVASYIDINDRKPRQALLLHIGMVAGMSFWPVERLNPPIDLPV
jgi:hypothetical protein